MDYLLRLYELLPSWLVAVFLAAASGSWIINYHWQRRYERLPLYPPMSLGVAVSLGMLALFYVGLSVGELPIEARAGGVRLLLLVVSVAMVVYNGGMVAKSITRSVKAWKRDH